MGWNNFPKVSREGRNRGRQGQENKEKIHRRV